ncbi:hypothetical protein IJ182_00915 [bacterium]|nr:hypothetical protein [bacterium]
MIRIFKKSVNILKNNSLFLQPLLLFFLTILSILIFLNGRTIFMPARISLLTAFIFMFIAYCAGWFHIIKQGIISYNKDDSPQEIAEKSISNFKKFFEGVGANFLKLFGSFIILFLIYSVVIFAVTKLCLVLYGKPEIIYDIQKYNEATSNAEKLNILNSIPVYTQLTFMKWVATLYPVSVVLNFFMVLSSAAIYFENTNFIKAIFKAIIFFFKNILICIVSMLLLQAIYIFINFISMLIGVNAISMFIVTVLITIYFTYYLILVFCIYYEKTKNNSDNRTELIG